MAPPPPKALLFDIGGVCVVSPFQAILDFERENGVPQDWVNFAISRSGNNGAWQRLERGEIKLDEEFFEGFRRDLHNEGLWKEFHRVFKARGQKDRTTSAANGPSAVGVGHSEGEKIEKDKLDARSYALATTRRAPPSSSASGSREDSMEQKDKVDARAYAYAVADKPVPDSHPLSSSPTIPPLPTMDTTTLFWSMMRIARTPDPHMYPALQHLKNSNRFILAALSNTVPFPPDHPYAEGRNDIKDLFDIFVSSSEVGLRKPDRPIYELALRKLDDWDRAKGGGGVRAEEVVFLDDIGTNLKTARDVGMRTIRVVLGRMADAVGELGETVRMDLGPRIEGKAKL